MTLGGVILQNAGKIPVLKISYLAVPEKVAAVLLWLFSAFLWTKTVIFMKIGDHIKENDLVTTGTYAWVRNPIYSAIMFILWAGLLWNGNIYLFPIGLFHWIFMTALMKCTEEKWLYHTYGEKYLDYCKKVNRCIPWLKK